MTKIPQATADTVTAALVDPTMLFRFESPIHYHAFDPAAESWTLPPACRLPAFSTLSGRARFAEVRMGWCNHGIVFWMQAANKRQLPWCRDGRAGDSDGLHLWIDTRNSPDIHRASRYCHHLVFCPMGGGPRRDRPFAALVPINRARENPQPIAPTALRVHAKLHSNGYQLSGVIAAAALTGFDPRDYSQLGFWWAVIDHELGWQTMTLSQDYPAAENPSLWSVAQLVRESKTQ
jgi:hypothetical protein